VAIPLALALGIVLIGLAIWLSLRALSEIKQLRHELDETQRQLNELKAVTEAVPAAPPPPLPRTRSSGLDDLREQLRAAHREERSDD
jgi:hypothetical protein